MSTATEHEPLYSSSECGTMPTSEIRIGYCVAGTYRIIRSIGTGASGNVFEVEHARLGRLFALKLLRPEIAAESQAARRFAREARVAATVRNEHVVSIVDCGEDGGRPYLVMELCEGRDLRALLREDAPTAVPRAVRLVIEAARGLSAIHDAGLVHRDLKPENLFVTRRCTGEEWCKVLDFGVAKASQSLSTTQGAIVGTVRSMAPEQLIDSSAVDASCDVYALGAVLYECLTGRPPNMGATVQETMFRILNEAPPSPRELRPEVSPRLDELVMRCLAKAPSERPLSMRRFLSELEEA
ncbi:MAG TPA: serine/threonine-protein kinase, partial [Polyangiaceae bacterium]|nr:serine/threonine-protein kinase [Polyangiaceae bacterium]